MFVSLVASMLLLTAPMLILGANASKFTPKQGLLLSWSFLTAYIVISAFIFVLRYYNGAWKRMQVIEEQLITRIEVEKVEACVTA